MLATIWQAGCGGGSYGGGGGAISVSVSPRQAAVVVTNQTQQFTAAVTGGTGGVTWTVDGMTAGSTAVGTISLTGLYTPPAAAGTHTIAATSTADTGKSASA
jgi:hypothetical protein